MFKNLADGKQAGDVDGDAKLVRARLDFVINAIARELSCRHHNVAHRKLR